MITLVLGGTRSGKSEVAERLAGAGGAPVSYLATSAVDDDEMGGRVAEHRARRPNRWSTVECGGGADLVAAVSALPADHVVLIDSLTAWVAGAEGFDVKAEDLCSALRAREAPTFVVSDEVGMGVHPSSEPGRRFRDALGTVNQVVSEAADEVLLVVAGRRLRLEAI